MTPAWRSAPRRSPSSVDQSRVITPSRATSTRSQPRGAQPGGGAACSSSCAAARSRRLARLRTTALPSFFVAVKPTRRGPSVSGRACSSTLGRAARLPLPATRRNSRRCFRRGRAMGYAEPRAVRSGGQALAALGAAVGDDPAAAHRLHAGAEAVPALPDELGGLIGTLHGTWLRSEKVAGSAGTDPVSGFPAVPVSVPSPEGRETGTTGNAGPGAQGAGPAPLALYRERVTDPSTTQHAGSAPHSRIPAPASPFPAPPAAANPVPSCDPLLTPGPAAAIRGGACLRPTSP